MDFTERVWCGSLRPEDAGREVLLAGWVDALRDHGEVLFAHLRDRLRQLRHQDFPDPLGVCLS